jgi:phage terminase small subunit
MKKNKETGSKPKLTTKQIRFVEEYCYDFNATAAAIRAGYSLRSAYEIGSQNLTKVEISKEIRARLDELSLKPEEGIKRLTDMGRASFAMFLKFYEDGRIELNLTGEEAQKNLHLIKKVKQTKKTAVVEGVKTETSFFEIELHDSKDAIKTLLEVYGRVGPKEEELTVNITF